MPIVTAAPPSNRFARGRGQLEAQQVHRRGLLVVLALEILVRDREDARAARDSAT